MTADEMRKGVKFQTGLTGKAKIALATVVLFAIALTVVVMMAVNGSFSLRGLKGDENPQNKDFNDDAFGLDAFAPEGTAGSKAAPSANPGNVSSEPATQPAPANADDGFFENNPFVE